MSETEKSYKCTWTTEMWYKGKGDEEESKDVKKTRERWKRGERGTQKEGGKHHVRVIRELDFNYGRAGAIAATSI